jgi:hypothetical protein
MKKIILTALSIPAFILSIWCIREPKYRSKDPLAVDADFLLTVQPKFCDQMTSTM